MIFPLPQPRRLVAVEYDLRQQEKGVRKAIEERAVLLLVLGEGAKDSHSPVGLLQELERALLL